MRGAACSFSMSAFVCLEHNPPQEACATWSLVGDPHVLQARLCTSLPFHFCAALQTCRGQVWLPRKNTWRRLKNDMSGWGRCQCANARHRFSLKTGQSWCAAACCGNFNLNWLRSQVLKHSFSALVWSTGRRKTLQAEKVLRSSPTEDVVSPCGQAPLAPLQLQSAFWSLANDILRHGIKRFDMCSCIASPHRGYFTQARKGQQMHQSKKTWVFKLSGRVAFQILQFWTNLRRQQT